MRKRIVKQIISLIVILVLLGCMLPIYVKADENTNNSINKEEQKRYVVLVLDCSGSIQKSIDSIKQGALSFCNCLINSKEDNNVAIICYTDRIEKCYEFTNNYDIAINSINQIEVASTGTDTGKALDTAGSLFANIPTNSNYKKDVVLFTDGNTDGRMVEEGPFIHDDTPDNYDYQRMNAVCESAKKLVNYNINIYTLGYYKNSNSYEREIGEKLLKEIQTAGYYPIDENDSIEFSLDQTANDIKSNKDAQPFKYASTDGGDKTATYYYTNDYFRQSGYFYNQKLCTMSLCMAMSAFGSNEVISYKYKSKNVKELMYNIGFTEFKTNEGFQNEPKVDSIGVAVSNKVIKDKDEQNYTLLAVAIRGANYRSEWASNFKIGKSGQHEGFNKAKEDVIEFLRNYIKERNITGNIKIWITGYSRAAATANLVAGALDNGVSLENDTILKDDNIYAYCFETPQGALLEYNVDDKMYNNINNIVNPVDPVPKVAPTLLGFRQYGSYKYIPVKSNDKSYNSVYMENEYQKLMKEKYIVDKFKMKKIGLGIKKYGSPIGSFSFHAPGFKIINSNSNQSMDIFLYTMINDLVREDIKSRDNYVENYQDSIMEILRIIYQNEDEDWDKLENCIKEQLPNLALSFIANISIQEKISKCEEIITGCLNEAGITNYTKEQVHKTATYLGDLISSYFIKHPNATVTLASNLDQIKAAHYPELCLAWMMSMDENYSGVEKRPMGCGKHRVIHINCPVDVKVYNKDKELKAAIVGEEIQNVDGSTINAYINDDGEKIVVLPADDNYIIDIDATDTGTVSYSIKEFSEYIGDNTRIVNYYDIPVEKGEEITATLPEYSEDDLNSTSNYGSSVAYSVLKGNNIIEKNEEMRGQEAANAYYMVNLNTNNELAGYITGQGIKEIGNYSMVTAIPYDGYEFLGWYKDDNCVSTEEEYRFRDTKDVTLEARFKEYDNTASLDSNTNSNIISKKGTENNSDNQTKSPKTGDSMLNLYMISSLVLIIIISYFANKNRIKKML